MFMKLYQDKRSALQGLLNSNGCALAWLNATVAFLVLPKGTRPLAKTAAVLPVLASSAKGDRGPAKSTVA